MTVEPTRRAEAAYPVTSRRHPARMPLDRLVGAVGRAVLPERDLRGRAADRTAGRDPGPRPGSSTCAVRVRGGLRGRPCGRPCPTTRARGRPGRRCRRRRRTARPSSDATSRCGAPGAGSDTDAAGAPGRAAVDDLQAAAGVAWPGSVPTVVAVHAGLGHAGDGDRGLADGGATGRSTVLPPGAGIVAGARGRLRLCRRPGPWRPPPRAVPGICAAPQPATASATVAVAAARRTRFTPGTLRRRGDGAAPVTGPAASV